MDLLKQARCAQVSKLRGMLTEPAKQYLRKACRKMKFAGVKASSKFGNRPTICNANVGRRHSRRTRFNWALEHRATSGGNALGKAA